MIKDTYITSTEADSLGVEDSKDKIIISNDTYAEIDLINDLKKTVEQLRQAIILKL